MITQTAQMETLPSCSCGANRVGFNCDDLYETRSGSIKKEKIVTETSTLKKLNDSRRWYGRPEMSDVEIKHYECSTGETLKKEVERDVFIAENGCNKCKKSWSYFRY